MSIMSYGELSSSNNTVENNRCSLRRIARHEEPEFSNASILNSMEKFVRTVNEMEETILVPSRLLDLAVADSTDTICQKVSNNSSKQISGCTNNNNSTTNSISNVKVTFCNTDLYRLYNIVNQMKVELLWSQENSGAEFDQEHISNSSSSSSSTSSSKSASSPNEQSTPVQPQQHMGHARCPSTTSMQSVQSASSMVSSASSASDSDSDTGIENDSGLESEEPTDRLANIAAENFRRHLRGLHRSINRMTEAAEYLTLRYQADVGGQV